MIGYTTLGTNDLAKATAFYDALFAEMGVKRMWEMPTMVCWGASMDKPGFVVCKPHDGNTATAGNGTMVALAMKDPAQVDAMYKKALKLGATDEGTNGPRGKSFYCGYVRDLDGNKLNLFCLV